LAIDRRSGLERRRHRIDAPALRVARVIAVTA
jgi:hypothetical protein